MRRARGLSRVFAIAAAAAAIAASPVHAQQLRGIVRDSSSGLPIAGAVVTTYDSLGRAGRRSLTNERGSYFVTAPPAARHLRVVRLGFRPVDAVIPAARDNGAQLDVVMSRIPYTLQPVRVTSGANCPRRSDRAEALSLLEEARAGLLATVVARSERPARMKRLMIDRRLDAPSNRVTRHRVRVETVPSTVAAFGAAMPASRFVSQGFAADSGEGATFHAPDADVLLDDGFAAGYCFHVVERDRARPNQVGLGFRAANRRKGRIDVDGALWIDTVARALVDIEYRYVGLHPTLSFFEPGGRVAFRELPNGAVLIDRWMLRLVGVETDTVRRLLDPAERLRAMGPVVERRIVIGEVGGELARATFEDGYTWFAALGTLALTVTNDSGVPKAGVIVRLDDTNYEATTDSAGRLEIVDVAPGRYSARVADDRLDAIDVTLATSLSFSAERNQTFAATLRGATAEDFVADRCRQDQRPAGFLGRLPTDMSAWVIGRVVSPERDPVASVQWTMRWYFQGTDGEAVAGAKTGTDGIFVFCGLSRGASTMVSFRKSGMEPGYISRVLGDPLNVILVQMDPERKRR